MSGRKRKAAEAELSTRDQEDGVVDRKKHPSGLVPKLQYSVLAGFSDLLGMSSRLVTWDANSTLKMSRCDPEMQSTTQKYARSTLESDSVCSEVRCLYHEDSRSKDNSFDFPIGQSCDHWS
jgi:hypothetical protein